MDETRDDESEVGSTPTQGTVAPVGSSQAVAWKPLTAKQRRVLGTLMEKSKTTPDSYPMTYTGLTTGCNQKSNREPITNFSVEQVETIVDELRELGAVTIVQGSGRVTKVKHYAYNWMGLNKVEAAILTELLLRGEQTLGELRTRVSRMEPIEDLNQLGQLFQGLKSRNLVVELTPPGRGQLVTHNLYPEWEIEQLQAKATVGVTLDSDNSAQDGVRAKPDASGKNSVAQELESLKQLVSELAAKVERIEKELGL